MLTLLRHGRTAANAQRLLQGRVDNELDQIGHAQAEAAAAAIGKVDRIIVSPLLRARQTASYLNLEQGSEVTDDGRLIELDYGIYDGRPLSDISTEMWARWQSDSSFKLPDGESLDDLRARVWSALDDLVEAARDSHVVVVSHVSPIKSAVQWALGASEEISWRLHLSTGSITRVDIRGTRPVLLSFNDISHHTAP